MLILKANYWAEAVLSAANAGAVNAMDELLKSKADVNMAVRPNKQIASKDASALHFASTAEVAKVLLDAKADIDSQTPRYNKSDSAIETWIGREGAADPVSAFICRGFRVANCR